MRWNVWCLEDLMLEGFCKMIIYFFGHRRLSIIDLGGSQQPFCSPCGRYTLVFNGENL